MILICLVQSIPESVEPTNEAQNQTTTQPHLTLNPPPAHSPSTANFGLQQRVKTPNFTVGQYSRSPQPKQKMNRDNSQKNSKKQKATKKQSTTK